MAGTTVAWKGLASGVLSRGGEGREHYLQERTKQRAIKKQHEGSHESGESAVAVAASSVFYW